MQKVQPIEEVITLVAMRKQVAIDDIERIFNLPNHATRNIIEFLIKFDFVKKVEGRYLTLSEACSPFFEEIIP